MSYVPIYTNSAYTLMNSTVKINDYITLAKKMGYQMLGLIDEDTLSGALTFYQACLKNEIQQIDCQIRGMHPWPVAFTTYQGKRMKIYRATVLEETTTQVPGTIIEKSKKRLVIACGQQTTLAIDELQIAGKAKQTIQDFLNGVGQHVQVGEKVGLHE